MLSCCSAVVEGALVCMHRYIHTSMYVLIHTYIHVCIHSTEGHNTHLSRGHSTFANTNCMPIGSCKAYVVDM